MASDRRRVRETRPRVPASPRAESPPAAPAIEAATGARAAWVLVAALVALVAAQFAIGFGHGMSWWGGDALRYAAPWFGWALAAMLPLSFVPPVARALEARLEPFGDSLARLAFGAGLLFAVAGAALVLVFPDRLWMMGDFLIRLGCTRGRVPTSMVFPQALPLDLLLHHEIPVALARAGLGDPNGWERFLGAVEALLLGLAAVAFARRLGLRGGALVATAGLVVFSGALPMFTGYGKGFVELTLATVASAAFALRVVQEGRGIAPLAAILGAALLLHRSAVVLLVPLAVTFALWWNGPGRRAGARRAGPLALFALPLLTAAAASPLIVAAMKATDARHLAPTGAGVGAILTAAFAPSHLREVLNLVLEAAPFALAAPFLAIVLGGALRARRREMAVLGAFALPALAILLFVHPRQGLFRDVDVFAPSLAALTLLAAMLVGETLRGGRPAWLAVPVLAFAVIGTVGRLSIAADVERGLARVRAYLEGPPRRDDEQRALLWSWMAERYLNARATDLAVASFEKAADLAPSPRILTELAMAETERGDFRGAQRAYRRAVTRSPGYTEGWLGLADVSIRAADWPAAEHALQQARVLEPARPEIAELGAALDRARGAVAGPR